MLGSSLLQKLCPMFISKDSVGTEGHLLYLSVAIKQLTLLQHENCWFSPDLRS